jgi:hypothetical protein
MKKAISLPALVCALSTFVFSTAYAQAYQWRFRAGPRNSPGSRRLSGAQLRLTLDSLRHKTGFLDMRFDEAGFLTLGDRTRYAGGSERARGLLIATVDDQQVFELEAHDHSPEVVIAQLTGGVIYSSAQTNARIKARQVLLDFADFAELRGDREAVAAFDLGFAALHELIHGVLGLRDADGERTQLGACDEQINHIRGELSLPEREGYIARVRPEIWPSRTRNRSELVFARVSTESGRARTEWFYLSWDTEKVSAAESVSSFRRRTP